MQNGLCTECVARFAEGEQKPQRPKLRLVVDNPAKSEPCRHPRGTISPGPRIPRRYGTGPTEICGACGMWRTAWETPGAWQPESTLHEAMQEDESV